MSMCPVLARLKRPPLSPPRVSTLRAAFALSRSRATKHAPARTTRARPHTAPTTAPAIPPGDTDEGGGAGPAALRPRAVATQLGVSTPATGGRTRVRVMLEGALPVAAASAAINAGNAARSAACADALLLAFDAASCSTLCSLASAACTAADAGDWLGNTSARYHVRERDADEVAEAEEVKEPSSRRRRDPLPPPMLVLLLLPEQLYDGSRAARALSEFRKAARDSAV